jgi:hypothetical protein
MEIKASVDVGQNITSMLERLAQQIGTTADKVFPWYVQQAIVEGWTTLGSLAIASVVIGTICGIAIWRADYDKGNPAALVSVISGFVLFFALLGTVFEGPDAVRKIVNPNYYAMTMMTRDIGRLVGK